MTFTGTVWDQVQCHAARLTEAGMQLCMEAAREAFFLGWEAGGPPLLTAACSTLLIGRSGNAEVDFFL